MELLVYVLLAIISALSLVVLLRLALDSYFKWSQANRRANELMRSLLSSKQYRQLMRKGYLDILSPSDPGRIYRVPRAQGLVSVIEHGRRKMSLCLQPVEWLPDADVVVLHILMIEANEETYLQAANKFVCI